MKKYHIKVTIKIQLEEAFLIKKKILKRKYKKLNRIAMTGNYI